MLGQNGVIRLVLRLIVAAGLAVDAYVHFDLASDYDGGSAQITQGTLFRIEAIAAVVAAVLVIAFRRWITDLFAFLVAIAGFAAVVLYRYVDVGAFGPFGNMYEPTWYAEKTLSAVAEGVAALAALPLVVFPRRREQPSVV
jgi:membrane protein required for beta-lactamase induction